MASGRDDDALTWDGDDDPTLDLSTNAEPDASTPTVLPKGFAAVGKGSEGVGSVDDAPVEEAPVEDGAAPESAGVAEKQPMGSGQLIALGVLGGVYALFAIGWLIGGLRLQGWRPFLVTDAMYQGSLWLAVLAPVLWFVTVFLLTRATRAWVRFAWLAGGVLLLLPWPFVLIGAVGR